MQTEPDYRELVEHAGDMIYTLDLSGSFTYVNAAGLGMLGYEAEELLGRHFGDVLTPTSADTALEHFQRGIEGTESTPFFEVQAVRKDGALVDVEVRAGNLYRDGEMIGRQGVARATSSRTSTATSPIPAASTTRSMRRGSPQPASSWSARTRSRRA